MDQPTRIASFFVLVQREFDLNDPVTGVERLVSDLEFDSFDLLRLMIMVESLTPGFVLPDELDFDTLTIGEVMEYMVSSHTNES